MFVNQWPLENTGQTGGTPDADIDAPQAWEIERGDPSVVVAIIDSGIDLDHPDLASKLWVNPGETPGNGLDDDGNGFIDDINGWDFASDDSNPDDTDDHGSHVAGIVAAAENGTGVVGVAPGVRLMVLRACDVDGCPVSEVAAAITYAEDNGAKVANLSLGAAIPAWMMAPVADAMSGAPGLLFAAAAGNGGADKVGDNNDSTPFYPASFSHSNLLSVAATDHDDRLASFSNYGATSVDLGAPGVSVQSSVVGGWAHFDGTSMATPHVSGVAALFRSRFTGASAEDPAQAILNAVDPVSELGGKTVTGGRLNAFAALETSSDPVAVATATPASGDIPLAVTFEGSQSSDADGTIATYAWSFSDGASSVGEIVNRTLTFSGVLSATLVVTDNDGRQDSEQVTVRVNAPPVAVATASPSLGIAPLLVVLDGFGSGDPDGTIRSYEWKLGNGATRSGISIVHDFERVGVHVAELTVRDDFGSSSSQAIEVLVGFPLPTYPDRSSVSTLSGSPLPESPRDVTHRSAIASAPTIM